MSNRRFVLYVRGARQENTSAQVEVGFRSTTLNYSWLIFAKAHGDPGRSYAPPRDSHSSHSTCCLRGWRGNPSYTPSSRWYHQPHNPVHVPCWNTFRRTPTFVTRIPFNKSIHSFHARTKCRRKPPQPATSIFLPSWFPISTCTSPRSSNGWVFANVPYFIVPLFRR